MKDETHTIRRELKGILIFLGVIWGALILNWIVPVDFNSYGLVPRTLSGAIGVVSMPFLHDGLGHLLGNTVSLFVLLGLLAGSKARSWETVAEIILLGGALLWLFGRNVTHVGASGLVFGLVAFLIVSGLLERRIISLIVSFIVGILYGGTLIWGVLPGADPKVSWDGHLCGAIAGGLIAWGQTRGPKQQEEPVDG